MPTEINRKIAIKQVKTPSGTIKVPVITEITFKDPVRRGQETTYTIDNSAQGDRDVHTAWVGSVGSVDSTETPDPDADVPPDITPVERIDLWRVKDPVRRGQQTYIAPDNKTFDKAGPQYFTTHLKTHTVKYRADPENPNSGTTIESELIDELIVKDPVRRGQQTHYFLQNPKDDDEANAQITDDLPDITDSDNGVDPPYRTDPFQNLIHVEGRTRSFTWYYSPWVIGFMPGTDGTRKMLNFIPEQGPGIYRNMPVPMPPGDYVLTGAPVVNGITWPGLQPWVGVVNVDVFTQPFISWDFVGGTVDPPTPTQGGGLPTLYAAGPSVPPNDGGLYVTIRSHPGDADPSVSHTWNYEGWAFRDGMTGEVSGYQSYGSLTTSMSGMHLTVHGTEWPCDQVFVYNPSYHVKSDPFNVQQQGPGQFFFTAVFREP